MKEIAQIVEQYRIATRDGLRTAIATVVHLEGSSYRRPGARMLVTEDGTITGSISGGCLEGDALRKAQLVIMRDRPKLVTYDTSNEEDASIGHQLGCAGIITVLFEPVGPANNLPMDLLERCLTDRQDKVLITCHSERQEYSGTCMLMLPDGTVIGSAPEGVPIDTLKKSAEHGLKEKRSYFHQLQHNGTSIGIFTQFVPPPLSLVIAGAGNDAIPLSAMATELGWQVNVIDGRHTHARQDRFGSSCQVFTGKPELLLEKTVIDHRTAVVMMTHNYRYDLEMLRLLIASASPYLGMLGPRKKLDRMVEELRKDGMTITGDMLSKVYGPVGLDLGAETPEEIALSILAEIQAVFSRKQAHSLRENPAVIHDRDQLKTRMAP